MSNVHFSSKKHDWATPQDLFNKLHKEFLFTIDAAATVANAKCARFFTENEDALKQNWGGERVFCNPPYGRMIGHWVKKMAEGGADVTVGLLPARTDTKWFHDFIYKKAEVRFIKGRLRFGGQIHSAPFPSMIVIWHNQ